MCGRWARQGSASGCWSVGRMVLPCFFATSTPGDHARSAYKLRGGYFGTSFRHPPLHTPVRVLGLEGTFHAAPWGTYLFPLYPVPWPLQSRKLRSRCFYFTALSVSPPPFQVPPPSRANTHTSRKVH